MPKSFQRLYLRCLAGVLFALVLFAAPAAFPDETEATRVDELAPSQTMDSGLTTDFPSTLNLPLNLPSADVTVSDDIAFDDAPLQAGVSHEAQALLSSCEGRKRDCLKLEVTMTEFLASGYSQIGDRIEAVLEKETRLMPKTDREVILPVGTLLIGEVIDSRYDTSKTVPKAILALRFRALVLPAQPAQVASLPIDAVWEKESSVLSVAGSAVGDAALQTSKGVLKGAWLGATRGLGSALYTQGASVLTSAAFGGAKGLFSGVVEHHSAIVLDSGDRIDLYLNDVPAMAAAHETLNETVMMATAAQPEHVPAVSDKLALAITATEKGVDPFNIPNQLRLTFELQNRLTEDLSAMNVGIVDTTGRRYFVSPFGGAAAYKTVFPAQHTTRTTLTFTVLSADVTAYYLVVYDPKNPRMVLLKIPVTVS